MLSSDPPPPPQAAAGTAPAAADNAGTSASAAGASEPVADNLAEDESTVSPEVPDSIPVRFAASNSPWLEALDATPGGNRYQAAIAARINLLFDETKAKLRESQEWEAIIPLTGDSIDIDNAIAVDFDDRDFSSDVPDGAIYVLPDFDLKASVIKRVGTDLKTKLAYEEVMTLQQNPALKLWSRPGETLEEFSVRCEAAADEGADEAAGKIRTKLEKKKDSVEAALAKAEDRVEELEVQAEGRKQQQWVDIGSSVLGGLLGGRSSARGMASTARRVSSSRRQKASSETRLDSAQNRVAEKIDALEDLEAELQDALIEIDDEWSAKATEIEEFEVPLEKTDITVEDLMLVWLPIER